MPTAPDANGLRRYVESDVGDDGTFSGLLNLALGWISDLLAPVGATLARTSDLPNGVSATPQAAPFQTAPSLRGMTWTSGAPTRVYATKVGRYTFRAQPAIGSTANGTAWLRVTRAAGGTFETPRVAVAHSGGIAAPVVLDTLTLQVGDYVELMVLSNATFTLYGALAPTTLEVDRISARA